MYIFERRFPQQKSIGILFTNPRWTASRIIIINKDKSLAVRQILGEGPTIRHAAPKNAGRCVETFGLVPSLIMEEMIDIQKIRPFFSHADPNNPVGQNAAPAGP